MIKCFDMFILHLDNLDGCYLRVSGPKCYYFGDEGDLARFVDRATAEKFIVNVCKVHGNTFSHRISIGDCSSDLIRSASIKSLDLSGWYSDNEPSDESSSDDIGFDDISPLDIPIF